VNSLPVDKTNALHVRSGDNFRINAQCPRKKSDERYTLQIGINYYSFDAGIKKDGSEDAQIKGTAGL